jgi:hypothetical protein
MQGAASESTVFMGRKETLTNINGPAARAQQFSIFLGRKGQYTNK